MSKDIRSFFAPLKKSGESKLNEKEEIRKVNRKKRVFNIADSDEEDNFVAKPVSKKVKGDSPQKKTPSPKKKFAKETPEKTVDIVNFFGKSPIQQKPQTLIKPRDEASTPSRKNEKEAKSSSKNNGRRSKGKKSTNAISPTIEDHFDDDFEATLCQLDEEKLGITPKKENLSSLNKSESIEEPSSELCTPSTEKRLEGTEKNTPSSIKTSGKKKNKNSSSYTLEIDHSKAPKKEKEEANIVVDERRKSNSEAYLRFLNRGGPKNPGSKPIPKGTPACLQGKTFVITGVLESLERDEAAELITKCGGRVTSSVSKKTSYVIIGDEPGESKLKKADQYNIPHLSEDGLLGLIRSFESSEGGSEESEYFSGSKRKVDEIKSDSPMKKVKIEDPNKNTPGKNKIKVTVDIDVVGKKLSTKSSLLESSSSSGLGSSIDSITTSPRITPGGALPRSVPSYEVGDMLWVEKYKPKSTKNIIGQMGEKSNVKKLTKWLTQWEKNHGHSDKKKPARPAPWAQGDDGAFYKAALLSGPPGVGKTTSVHLVCQELGYDVVEFNASDTRSKRLLSEHVSELLASKSIRNFYSVGDNQSKKHVLVMDEVDGMAGNEDRGGVQELIQLIKGTKVPVICMCNDRSHPKMRSLVNYCFDLRFNRPRVDQIKGAMLSICCKEGIKVPPESLNDMIVSANQDVRQVLHNLSLWAVKDKSLTAEQVKADSLKAKKYLKMGPWDVARQVFSSSEQEKTNLREKEDLFFQDYSLGPLFVQDTYVHVKPYKARGDKRKTLECLSRAADSLAWGDVIERNIRSKNAWGLLPVQAIFSSVIPGHEMAGHVTGQITFPAWLGKNSKRGRMDRLLQELHIHSRLNTSGSKKAMNLDYSTSLRNAVLLPLSKRGTEGIPAALEVMHNYKLLREDLDSLVELCQWPNQKDLFAEIESKIKAAFTRAYNKESPATPYAANFTVKKSKVDESELLEEALAGEEGSGDMVDEDEEKDDISTDAMIKKGKGKKPAAKKDVPTTSAESRGKSSKRGGKSGKK